MKKLWLLMSISTSWALAHQSSNTFEAASFAVTDVATYTRVGENSGILTPNKIRLSAIFVDRPGVPLRGRVFVDSGIAAHPIRMALYSDDNNRPGRLMAETFEFVIPGNVGGFWAEMDFINSPVMVRNMYWVGVLAGNSWDPARYRFYTQFDGVRFITNDNYAEGFYPIFNTFEDILRGTISAGIYYRPIKE